jgi:hypothetical protein
MKYRLAVLGIAVLALGIFFTADVTAQPTCIGCDGGSTCGCYACVRSSSACYSCRNDYCQGSTGCDSIHSLCICDTSSYGPCGPASIHIEPTLEPVLIALHRNCENTGSDYLTPLSRGGEAP